MWWTLSWKKILQGLCFRPIMIRFPFKGKKALAILWEVGFHQIKKSFSKGELREGAASDVLVPRGTADLVPSQDRLHGSNQCRAPSDPLQDAHPPTFFLCSYLSKISNTGCTWETNSTSLWDVLTPSGFIARVFLVNCPPYCVWILLCIGNPKTHFLFFLYIYYYFYLIR